MSEFTGILLSLFHRKKDLKDFSDFQVALRQRKIIIYLGF